MAGLGFNLGGRNLNKKAKNLRTFIRQWNDYAEETQEKDRNFIHLNNFDQSDADYVLTSFNIDNTVDYPIIEEEL